jgi:hypothetical protein
VRNAEAAVAIARAAPLALVRPIGCKDCNARVTVAISNKDAASGGVDSDVSWRVEVARARARLAAHTQSEEYSAVCCRIELEHLMPTHIRRPQGSMMIDAQSMRYDEGSPGEGRVECAAEIEGEDGWSLPRPVRVWEEATRGRRQREGCAEVARRAEWAALAWL